MKKTSVLRGAAIITVFSLACKLLGTLLRLYTASRIGSEGMGLYSLIMSVYTLFTAAATAGLVPVVSRLSAKYDSLYDGGGYRMFAVSLLPSLAVGLLSAVFMYAFARPLAQMSTGDIRTAAALRTLAFSLPCMSVTSCIKGLFLSKGEVLKNSTGSLTEQTVKMTVAMLILGRFMKYETDTALLCNGITASITCGEIFSLVYLGSFALAAKRKKCRAEYMPMAKELISVGAPIAASTVATSLLHTGESILIPLMLMKYSGDRSASLAQFGVIRGMTMPLIFFPFAFLNGLSTVLVPELSRLSSADDRRALKERISKSMTLAYLFGIAASAFFYFTAEKAAKVFYPSADAAPSIKIMALVTAFMYAETVCDSMLKALGQEKHTLLYCLINSALRISAVLLLIPHTGINGYLALLVVSNILQYILAISRLHKVTGYRILYTKSIILPTFGALCGGLISSSGIFSGRHLGDTTELILRAAIFAVIFVPACIPALKEVKK